ncbi:hypothetical protein Cabys_1033 [Caldithrix abyssi DSM 13497]|uniref:Uncharacterized protein n=1 Tax=Caldithrix abyssi DSM 13497 TaxID=880073 RepID=A0A1J1C5E0_CALAY|nr:hypothetical protein Cabys_1033 [Caldithrix abyssi DSM 13497]
MADFKIPKGRNDYSETGKTIFLPKGRNLKPFQRFRILEAVFEP